MENHNTQGSTIESNYHGKQVQGRRDDMNLLFLRPTHNQETKGQGQQRSKRMVNSFFSDQPKPVPETELNSLYMKSKFLSTKFWCTSPNTSSTDMLMLQMEAKML